MSESPSQRPHRSFRDRTASRSQRSIAWAAMLFASGAATFGGTQETRAQPPSAVAPGTVFWPRKDFVIPFQVDPAGESPSEIRLEVSENRGGSWNLYTRGDVRTRQFHFHAQRDGEYRFRLKTVDRNGNVYDNPGEPLQVIVDTTKPTGELIVDIDPKGTMLAEFRITDVAIDRASIRLEFQSDAQTSWSEIQTEIEDNSGDESASGFGSWDVAATTTQIIVRLTARDRAGNSMELIRMPRLPRSASLGQEMKFASSKDAKTSDALVGSGIVKRPNNTVDIAPPTGRQPGSMLAPANEIPKVEVLGGPGARPPSALVDRDAVARQQVLESQDRLIEYQNRLLMQQRAVSGLPSILPKQQVAPELMQPSLLPTRPVDGDASNTSASVSPIGVSAPTMLPHSNTAINTNLASSGTDVNSPSSIPSPPSLPSGMSTPQSLLAGPDPSSINNPVPSAPPASDTNTLHSSSKIFSLDYAIDNDPGAAVASVELWGTVDQGARWEKWGVDADRESPFEIEVESEGLFGFRMVIVGSNGLASRRPLPGDDADTWIQVDTTAPQAKIISVLNGKGQDAGSMIIEYLAIDDHFSDRPISFSYSESPRGPWQPIAQGARNNSRYVWTPDPNLPPKVYLRMDAMDAAGNVASHQLDLPIDVQGALPRGRIQGFRPIK